jgi:hypothetical protein
MAGHFGEPRVKPAPDAALNPQRLAALTLHGLSVADRQWVLGQLRPVQRAELETLLAELRELGIPSDPGLVEAAVHPQPGEPSLDVPPPAPIDSTPQILADLFRDEPDGLVSLYLHTLEASGADQVLMQFPSERVVRLRSPLPAALRQASGLREALREVVRTRTHSPVQAHAHAQVPVFGDLVP